MANPPFAHQPAASQPLPIVQRGRRGQRIGLLGWLLYGVLLVYVWRVQDLYPIVAKLQIPSIVSLAAIAAFFFSPMQRELRRIRHPILVAASLILGLMLLSVPFSLHRGISFWFIFSDHVKTFVMTLIIAASIRVAKDVERYAILHVFGAAMYSVLILTRFEIDQSGRFAHLVYYDANDLAFVIVCVLPLTVYFMRAGVRTNLRVLALLTAGLFIVTLVKTGSRGGFLGLIAVVGYLVAAYRAVPLRARVSAVAVGTVMLLLVGTDKYWNMMQTLLNPTADYNWAGQSDEGRIEIWKRGMTYMIQHPLTGVGVAAFPVAEGTISPLAPRQAFGLGVKWGPAHNSYVQIGAELGIGGLLLFLAILYCAFKATIEIGRGPPRPSKGRRSDEAALAQALTGTLVGYCVAGFFLTQAYSAFLYSIFGLLTGFWYVTVGRWNRTTRGGR